MKNIQLFFYGVRTTEALANDATVQKTVTISNESNFELQEIRTSGNTLVFCSIADENGNGWSNQSFNLEQIGKGQDALKLFGRKPVIARNSRITITFTNSSGASINAGEIELNLIGYKL